MGWLRDNVWDGSVVQPEYDALPWNEAELNARFSSHVLEGLCAQGCKPIGLVRMRVASTELFMALLSTANEQAFIDISGKVARRGGVEFSSVLVDGSVIATERMARERGAAAAHERLREMSPSEAAGEALLLNTQAKETETAVRCMASATYRLELVAGDVTLDALWERHRNRLAEHQATGGAVPTVHDAIGLRLALHRAVAEQRARRRRFSSVFENLTFLISFIPGVTLGVRACFASGARLFPGLAAAILIGLLLPFWWAMKAPRVGVRLYRVLSGGTKLDLRNAIAACDNARRSSAPPSSP